MREPMHVVGAGLVGSLLSIYLAKRGFSVTVHERRADMRRESVAAGRSINLAISTRGFAALREVGLEQKARDMAIPMIGRKIHPISGPGVFQKYGRDSAECIYSISRSGLNELLMNEAERDGQTKILFNRKITALSDLPAEARIFGTDGSGSVVRAHILEAQGTQDSHQILDAGYKEIVMPALANGDFALEKNALHIWPRGKFMLIALPNLDGSFTCTLFLPFEGESSFAQLKDPASVNAFFARHFSEVLPLLPNLTEDFFTHPTGQMVTVRCRPWSIDDRAILLGDAAHAIVPFFGQGMNCGFEDVQTLGELLDRWGTDWTKIFAEYEKLRKPNADAIADLAIENFIEMRDRVTDARFQLERQVEKVLEREFPEEYFSRYTLVTFTRVPYQIAQQAGIVVNGILGELCRDLKDPESVDRVRAKSLIESRLLPVIKGRG